MKSKCPFVLNIQLAKLAGNKVVATCGGESKSTFLTSLGIDRVINYRSEKIKDVSFCSSLSYLSFILQLFIIHSLLFIFQMFKLDNISFGSFLCWYQCVIYWYYSVHLCCLVVFLLFFYETGGALGPYRDFIEIKTLKKVQQ